MHAASLEKRFRQAGLALAVLGTLSASASARAQDNRVHHPLTYTRLAVSDQSVTSGVQPWVWTVTAGTPTIPAQLLAKRADSSDTGSWIHASEAGLTTAAEAISYAEGTSARQRIFYARGGAIRMLNFDDNANNNVSTLPNPPNALVQISDLAAVSFSFSPRQMAVAAYASVNGVAGFLCFWERAVTATSWSSACTTSAVMPASAGVPDIVGIVQANTPQFFFRNAAGRLGRATRTGIATYSITEHGTDQISHSLFVTESQSAGAIDVGVIRTSDMRVRVGRRTTPTSGTSWVTLPALPNGAIPASSNVALSGAKFQYTNQTTRTHVTVVSEQFRLHTIRTSNDAGSSWQTAWSAPLVPGNPNTTGPEQVPFAVGPIMTSPTGTGTRMFFVGGGAFGQDWATTLQEHQFLAVRPWRDHIRLPTSSSVGLVPTATGANESSAGGGPVMGIITAIQRNAPSPWRVLVASSDDNGSSYGAPVAVLPFIDDPLPYSQTDPTAAHGGLGGHLLHMVDLEMRMLNLDASNCTKREGQVGAANYRIAYRRGITAQDIAQGLSFPPIQVATGSPSYDHPGLGVTVNSSDLPAAHVVYWDSPNETGVERIKLWMLLQNDVQSGPHIFDPAVLPPNPPAVTVGFNQSVVYAWTFPLLGGFPTICRLNGSATTGLDCGKPSLTPAPAPKDMHFGTGEITDAETDCDGLTSGGMTKFRKCFDTAQPIAIAADPTQDRRVHMVYQAPDGVAANKLAIWYTRNTDNNLDVWTTPQKIAASTGGFDLFNPNITIDYQGTIVVTYSRMVKATFSTGSSGAAEVLVTWSTLDSPSTWSTGTQIVALWNATNLPWHCSRKKWFFGEYRYGDVVASRAQHLIPTSSGLPGALVSQHGRWFSRQYGLNP